MHQRVCRRVRRHQTRNDCAHQNGGRYGHRPKAPILDRVENLYVIQSNGVALYRDKNHLTVQGAQFILLPLFRESLTIE